MGGKKKWILLLVLAVVIVIGIVLIATDRPAKPDRTSDVNNALAAALFSGFYDEDEPAYSSGFYPEENPFYGYDDYYEYGNYYGYDDYPADSSDCFWCNDTGKCPECRGLKDCQYKYGASHRCINGTIYYGGDTIPCPSCDSTGDCSKCDGTGFCPYCR